MPQHPDAEQSEKTSLSKHLRLQQEAQALQTSLKEGSLTDLKTRVAWVLNLYPHTRNSDISLSLKYWELYQPDIYNSAALAPRDLFRLERTNNITRVRAKIQNEYHLFPADDAIKNHRKQHEEDIREEVVEDKPARNLACVFADETGKTQDYICVAAVWVLTGYSVFKVSQSILRWKPTSPWGDREIHFADFKKHHGIALREYLDLILKHREFLSFKVIAFERVTARRPVEEIVHRLHEFMVTRGAKHEIDNNRIRLPYELQLTVDAETSLDTIACADIKHRIASDFTLNYGEQLRIDSVDAVQSHRSPLVQLADVIAGAVNRRKNHRGERGFKDDYADMIIDMLGIQLEQDAIPEIDATAWLSV
jgi:hypothetical protein